MLGSHFQAGPVGCSRLPCPQLAPMPSTRLKNLDVSVLHEDFHQALGFQGIEFFDYTQRPAEAIDAVSDYSPASCLMIPPTVEDMQEIAVGGLKMPQKGQLLYPKIFERTRFVVAQRLCLRDERCHFWIGSAPEGIPALYQSSAVSRYARKHGGKDLRSRAAAVVDDLIKVDFGPDTYAQAAREQLNPASWQSLFFTHSDDHLCASELQYCMFPFTEHEFCPFPIFGNEVVIAEVKHRASGPLSSSRVSFESVKWQDYTNPNQGLS